MWRCKWHLSISSFSFPAQMDPPRCPKCGSVDTRAPVEEPRNYVPPGTRHHELLHSNEVPLESDWHAVQSIISKTSARLSFLDEQTSRLRDRLKELEEEHASLARYRAQNIAIFSPLRRMPPEVLAEIFSWTLPLISEALEEGHCRFDIGKSPWVLTHINSRWRAVALSTASLWSLVAIEYSDSCRYPLPMVEIQLARARNLKIHFYGCEESDSRPQIAIFKSLAKRSLFWEELSIGLTSHLFPLLSTLRNRVPSLRRLWIQWDTLTSPTAMESIDCFHTAPSLRDAGILNRCRPVPIFLPAHQLTRYQLDGPWEMHQTILKLAENLVEAKIDISLDEEPWPEVAEDGDIITLRRLLRLGVSDTGILNYLRTPALEEVSCFLQEKYYMDSMDLLHLGPFFVRSACSIRRLCLRGSPNPRQVSETLQKFPSITELAIITCGEDLEAVCEVGNTIIADLTSPHPTDSATVAPQLSKIDFGCEDETYIDHALYLKMLESRWRADNCALKAAALVRELGPGPNPVTLGGLNALCQDGLDLFLAKEKEGEEVISDWLYVAMWT
ncbi:hypothetical protein DFH09DRAFT_1033835 [Mycena vulgaris]|nr:hypothetical protein DFH09DRAFT_1033835 [Mycena vulgaris]